MFPCFEQSSWKYVWTDLQWFLLFPITFTLSRKYLKEKEPTQIQTDLELGHNQHIIGCCCNFLIILNVSCGVIYRVITMPQVTHPASFGYQRNFKIRIITKIQCVQKVRLKSICLLLGLESTLYIRGVEFSLLDWDILIFAFQNISKFFLLAFMDAQMNP